MAYGKTRRITKKQARSYQMSRPNPMGVTSIASVNSSKRRRVISRATQERLRAAAARKRAQLRAQGRKADGTFGKAAKNTGGSYSSRYERTRALLKGDQGMRTRRRSAARRNGPAKDLGDLFDIQMGRGPKKKKMSRARREALSKARRAAEKKRIGKKYGPYKSLVGRVGTRRVPTYAYQGRKGKPKKIPLWAISGAKSKRDFERRVADSPRLARKVVAAKARRERRAAHLASHGDLFTPNKKTRRTRRRVVPYQTWSANMGVRRARSNKKLRGKAKAAFLARMARGRRAAARRAGGGGKRTRRSAGKRTAAKRTGGRRKARTPAQRRATAAMLRARWGKKTIRRRKAWANTHATPNRRRRRKARRNTVITQAAANRRRRRKARRNPITQAAANRRRRRKARRNTTITQAAANPRRRRRRKARRNPITQAAANRPRRRRRRKARRNQTMYMSNRRRGRRRHARRNQTMYMSNRRRRRHARRNPDLQKLKEVLMIGAKVAVGFFVHRGLSYVVSEKLLSKVEVFSTGSLAEYRGVLSSALVAGAGILGLAKFAPEQVKSIGVGMATSFVHKVVMFGLAKLGQAEIAGYLGGYPDAEGRAFYNMSGYGEYDYYNQYSGMGQGMGSYFLEPGMSGFGDPALGEYFAPGLQGIGEYEATSGYAGALGAPAQTYDGIHPNLTSAEQALSVAEAAAGIGDLGYQSTVNAYQVAAPILDAPAGSRAGILEGSEGIFG